jgi:aminoglycoside phosphotransferase (APT) family kinase protein
VSRAGTDQSSTDDTVALVRRFLVDRLPGATDVRVDHLVRMHSGFSRENWVFDASWTADGVEHHEPMIVRRDPLGSVLDTDRGTEFAVLTALAGTAVPAPVARWLDADGAALGRPSLVMRREDGVCDWFVLNGDRPLEDRVALAGRLLDLLAEIQRVDWAAVGLDATLPDPGPEAALVAVDHWEGELRRHQLEPHPELEIVSTWLRAHAPISARTVLVHGDFKPGNVLLVGDEIRVLLDWETVHLGHPLEDLGWITNPIRAREHQIPGHWERDEIVVGFTERTGLPVDPDALRWWNVLAGYKTSVIVLTGIDAFVDGRLDRIHLSPLAVVKLMYDLMGL